MKPRAKIAVILAGGQGRRMTSPDQTSTDKGLLKLGRHRLVDYAYARLRTQKCEIYISGRHDYGLDLPVISDRSDGPKGPAAGLFSISTFLQTTGVLADGFMTIPIDSPLFPTDLCQKLYCATQSCIAEDELGLHPVFGWWRQNDLLGLWPQHNMRTSLSLTAIAQHINAKKHRWAGQDLFTNINTPNDMAKITFKLDPANKQR